MMLLSLLATTVFSKPLVLTAEHPNEYVVQEGDTLWTIAERFLDEPWRWPELWRVSSQLTEPYCLYPGDTLVLTWDTEGQPYLQPKGKSTVTKKLPEAVREGEFIDLYR